MFIKIENGQIKQPPKNTSTVSNYIDDTELLIKDGYRQASAEEIGLINTGMAIVVDGVIYDLAKTEAYITRQIIEREEKFKREFFKTSIGWIRREVTLKNGDTEGFIKDNLPLIGLSITDNGLPAGVFVYYDEPLSYSEDLVLINHDSPALTKLQAQQFVGECILQKAKDFR